MFNVKLLELLEEVYGFGFGLFESNAFRKNDILITL